MHFVAMKGCIFAKILKDEEGKANIKAICDLSEEWFSEIEIESLNMVYLIAS